MIHFTLEIVSPGAPRPQMSTHSVRHQSRQIDSWRAVCKTLEESQRLSRLVRGFLDDKLVHYLHGGETLRLTLRQPLGDEEARKVSLAMQELPRKRFEGPDTPNSMEEFLNG